MASSLLSLPAMPQTDRSSTTPESVAQAVQAYLDERPQLGRDLPEGARAFAWCGDTFDYLIEGLTDRLAARGIDFTSAFPGPFRLWDEDQQPDGEHVRRFWTTALAQGCPVARLCTYFFHRHDTPAIPRPPLVVAFPPDYPDCRGDEPDGR
ncbi:MAG: hypothetical protein ACKOCD_02240 [Nitrospiraceae bacterium]